MRFRRGPVATDEPEINLVPLIDVLLVLLIFLTATTTFARFGELGIALPAAETTPAEPAPQVGVEVAADGRYAIDGAPLEGGAAALASALRAAAANRPDTLVVIYADAQANHQAVIDVLQAARTAGVTRLSFGARNTGGSP